MFLEVLEFVSQVFESLLSQLRVLTETLTLFRDNYILHFGVKRTWNLKFILTINLPSYEW